VSELVIICRCADSFPCRSKPYEARTTPPWSLGNEWALFENGEQSTAPTVRMSSPLHMTSPLDKPIGALLQERVIGVVISPRLPTNTLILRCARIEIFQEMMLIFLSHLFIVSYKCFTYFNCGLKRSVFSDSLDVVTAHSQHLRRTIN